MRKQLYLALCEMLRKCPDVNHVSLWNHNIEELEREKTYSLPAVFIEFTPFKWQQGGQGTKKSSIQINLHIVTKTLADPDPDSPFLDEALAGFDIIEQVINSVQGNGGEGFNRLQHVETIPDHNHDEIQHDVEAFSCEIWDYSHKNDTSSIPLRKVEISPNKA